jgi:hypothetical protein
MPVAAAVGSGSEEVGVTVGGHEAPAIEEMDVSLMRDSFLVMEAENQDVLKKWYAYLGDEDG